MAQINKCIGFTHTIEKGDTLYLLGKKYKVRVSALIFANPYLDIYNLQVGDQICIPKYPPLS
ncbi:MAG: LysM domain-containing protein [Lachnospiraceae bacterium]|nr:LysM domain-containing protein [Lachnospiraceae bacterium]MDD7078109.1 LysM domain-containing protein [Lachnospiraceae bacterium]MDY3729626.1 LysM domain-containing protein [Candidatus Choladocola sp.]